MFCLHFRCDEFVKPSCVCILKFISTTFKVIVLVWSNTYLQITRYKCLPAMCCVLIFFKSKCKSDTYFLSSRFFFMHIKLSHNNHPHYLSNV